jgi:hypothetical protein
LLPARLETANAFTKQGHRGGKLLAILPLVGKFFAKARGKRHFTRKKESGRKQKAEGRKQKAEGRKQKAEGRKQKESGRRKIFPIHHSSGEGTAQWPYNPPSLTLTLSPFPPLCISKFPTLFINRFPTLPIPDSTLSF